MILKIKIMKNLTIIAMSKLMGPTFARLAKTLEKDVKFAKLEIPLFLIKELTLLKWSILMGGSLIRSWDV